MRHHEIEHVLECFFVTSLPQILHTVFILNAQRFYLIDKHEPILTYIAVPERKISLKWREKRPLCPKFMACPTYALVPNLHLERHQSAVQES